MLSAPSFRRRSYSASFASTACPRAEQPYLGAWCPKPDKPRPCDTRRRCGEAVQLDREAPAAPRGRWPRWRQRLLLSHGPACLQVLAETLRRHLREPSHRRHPTLGRSNATLRAELFARARAPHLTWPDPARKQALAPPVSAGQGKSLAICPRTSLAPKWRTLSRELHIGSTELRAQDRILLETDCLRPPCVSPTATEAGRESRLCRVSLNESFRPQD